MSRDAHPTPTSHTPMQVKVYQGGNLSSRALDEHPFGEQVLYRTLKDSVISYQANQRQGTVATKGRGDIAGSGKKPWKQKHTGRARAGDRKSPIWRGGGTVFGPLPRDYRYDLPAHQRRVALRTAILGKLQDGEVVLADLASFTAPSAKAARKLLADVGSPNRALVVLTEPNESAWKSFRNFPRVVVRPAIDLCAFDVVANGLVICEPGAFEALGNRVGLIEKAGDGEASEGGGAATAVKPAKAKAKTAKPKAAKPKAAAAKPAAAKKKSAKSKDGDA